MRVGEFCWVHFYIAWPIFLKSSTTWVPWLCELFRPILLLCSGAPLEKMAGTYGDLRVYDVVDDAKRKYAMIKTKKIKKKSKSNFWIGYLTYMSGFSIVMLVCVLLYVVMGRKKRKPVSFSNWELCPYTNSKAESRVSSSLPSPLLPSIPSLLFPTSPFP